MGAVLLWVASIAASALFFAGGVVANRFYYLKQTTKRLRFFVRSNAQTDDSYWRLAPTKAGAIWKMRIEIANGGPSAVTCQRPFRIRMPTEIRVVDAAIVASAPEGIRASVSIDADSSPSEVIVDAPVLNTGERLSIRLMLDGEVESKSPLLEVTAEGVKPQLQPEVLTELDESRERRLRRRQNRALLALFGWSTLVFAAQLFSDIHFEGALSNAAPWWSNLPMYMMIVGYVGSLVSGGWEVATLLWERGLTSPAQSLRTGIEDSAWGKEPPKAGR